MSWTTLVLFAVILAAFLLYRQAGLISVKAARARLKSGAQVIDVRTAGEIETSVTRRVKDKDQVLLLHCQSGARSSIAKKKLKSLGYLNTFNLGSYDRASHIVYGK